MKLTAIQIRSETVHVKRSPSPSPEQRETGSEPSPTCPHPTKGCPRAGRAMGYSQHGELAALLEHGPTHRPDPVPFQIPAGKAIVRLPPRPCPRWDAPKEQCLPRTRLPKARYSQPAQLRHLRTQGGVGYFSQGVVQHVPAGRNRRTGSQRRTPARDAPRGLSAGARPPRRAAAHSSTRGELRAGGTSSTALAAPAPRTPAAGPAVGQPLLPRAKGWCMHLTRGAELHSPSWAMTVRIRVVLSGCGTALPGS